MDGITGRMRTVFTYNAGSVVNNVFSGIFCLCLLHLELELKEGKERKCHSLGRTASPEEWVEVISSLTESEAHDLSPSALYTIAHTYTPVSR